MAYSASEQACIDVSAKLETATKNAIKAFKALCGPDLSSATAATAINLLLAKIRTLDGKVVSVNKLKGNEFSAYGALLKNYERVYKAFQRARAASKVPDDKGPYVPSTFSQSLGKAIDAMVTRIQKAKPEKVTFDIPMALAALQVAKKRLG